MKTTMKKNIGVLVAVVAVVLGVMAFSRSLAYFTAEKDHDAEYELSMIDTTVTEEFEPETDKVFIKNPQVTNQGKSDAVVRVRVEVTPSTQKDNIKFIDVDEKNNWLLADDGYYYYQGVLPVGETTDTLFDKVEILDLDKMEDFDIIVYSEAIQTTVYDEDGKEVASALKDGKYNQENALALWKHYK